MVLLDTLPGGAMGGAKLLRSLEFQLGKVRSGPPPPPRPGPPPPPPPPPTRRRTPHPAHPPTCSHTHTHARAQTHEGDTTYDELDLILREREVGRERVGGRPPRW